MGRGFWRDLARFRTQIDCRPGPRFDGAMPRDPYIREKFTRLRITAKKVAAEYFERFPKDRYLTEIEGWRRLQLDNIEFTMKRLRDPVDNLG